jgi:DNA-directed RNA polymerase subunit RPC12/RpoP
LCSSEAIKKNKIGGNEMSEHEVISEDYLVCPYCGHEDKWADRELDVDEWTTYECGNCQKNFSARKEIKTIFKSDLLD